MTIDLRAVPNIPEDPAFDVAQLTPEDFSAVTAFLYTRLDELVADGHHAAAAALGMSLDPALDTLRSTFTWETDYPREPVPNSWLRERETAWNRLVIVLWSGWHDAEGYDRKRWALVRSIQPATAQ
nr:hypothetical protein KPHV_08380 [Kitasatospora purpeofusca]